MLLFGVLGGHYWQWARCVPMKRRKGDAADAALFTQTGSQKERRPLSFSGFQKEGWHLRSSSSPSRAMPPNVRADRPRRANAIHWSGPLRSYTPRRPPAGMGGHWTESSDL